MPNWTTNQVKMKGIADKSFYTEDDHGTTQIDFQKIIPMPDDLNINSGSSNTLDIRLAMKTVVDYLNSSSYIIGIKLPEVDEYLSKYKGNDNQAVSKIHTKHDMEEHVKQGLQCIQNIINHGHPTWYEWRNQNWGVKWNASDTVILDDDTIEFNTPWYYPEPIFKEISRQNPCDLLQVDYTLEGDIGLGHLGYLDGDNIEDVYERLYDLPTVQERIDFIEKFDKVTGWGLANSYDYDEYDLFEGLPESPLMLPIA